MDNDPSPAAASPSKPKTDKRSAAEKAAAEGQAQQLKFFARVAELESDAIDGMARFFAGLSSTLHLGGDAEEGRQAFLKAAAELRPLLKMGAAGMKAHAEQLTGAANG